MKAILTRILPDGVTVAQLILVQFVLVRIQVGQPFFCPHAAFVRFQITGETRREVSDRLENEALQVPGFQFTDIAGHKWSHKSYFEMLARTELMNGARDSYEQQCAAEGYNIMLLSVSGHCCEACAQYEGQYFSIGPNKYGLPTKDDLEAEGVFHPNCTHSYSAVPDYIIEKEFNVQTGKREHGSYGSVDHAQEQQAKQQQRALDKVCLFDGF